GESWPRGRIDREHHHPGRLLPGRSTHGGGTADSADDDPRASVGLRRRKRRGGSCRTAPQWLWRRRVARGGVAAPRCALTATWPEMAARSPPTLLSTGSLAIRSGELRFDTSARAHPGPRS